MTAARLKGLETDLGLTGRVQSLQAAISNSILSADIQYSTVLAVLYASYCPAQIPSNMILNRVSRYVERDLYLRRTHVHCGVGRLGTFQSV